MICDDHPVVREGMRSMLEKANDIIVVGEAVNGIEAVNSCLRHRPDVTLMDLRMPVMDGVHAIREIKAVWPASGILVITTYETDADVLQAIERGASGYLLKDAPRAQLHEAVRTVASGRSYLAAGAATRLVERMRGGSEKVLTGREIEVLELAAEGANNKEISESLWVSENTVKTYWKSILPKLRAKDRTSAVAEAMRRGTLRLEPRGTPKRKS